MKGEKVEFHRQKLIIRVGSAHADYTVACKHCGPAQRTGQPYLRNRLESCNRREEKTKHKKD